jgi:DNA (cytosine-5)-methyltransferase 1
LNFSPSHKHTYVNDIRDLQSGDIPKHDVLVAGFPCQPYSIAGLRKGLLDERGAIFMEIIRILRDKKPKAFLLENVKGIIAHEKGATFSYMVSLLEELGYTIKYQVLNSMTHANVAQNRERVFMVGFIEPKSTSDFEFPSPLKLKSTIHDSLQVEPVAGRFYYDERYGCFTEIKKYVKSRDTLYQWRRHYVRENKSSVCPTLTANMGSGGHNVPLLLGRHGIRKLTPRECANFQGFPQSFKLPQQADSRLYHQFGNSVTVPLIKRIAQEMVKAMS